MLTARASGAIKRWLNCTEKSVPVGGWMRTEQVPWGSPHQPPPLTTAPQKPISPPSSPWLPALPPQPCLTSSPPPTQRLQTVFPSSVTRSPGPSTLPTVAWPVGLQRPGQSGLPLAMGEALPSTSSEKQETPKCCLPGRRRPAEWLLEMGCLGAPGISTALNVGATLGQGLSLLFLVCKMGTVRAFTS